MKKHVAGAVRWLVLAAALLAAGFFYSCGPLDSGAIVPEKAELEAKTGFLPGDGKTEEKQDRKAGETGTGEKAGETGTGEEAGETGEGGNGGDRAGEREPSSEEKGACYVYVCGQVANPGVYQLSEGQRVYEAIELAGGALEHAALTWLNLAEPVRDGMKLYVPDLTEMETGQLLQEMERSAESKEGKAAKVNLNTATKEELMTLTGIGEVRAQDIIRVRRERGGFERIEDVMEVPGIKDGAFQKIKEDITV